MKLKTMIDKLLREHFFVPEDSRSLSLFRFLFCTAVAIMLVRATQQHVLMHSSVDWNPIPIFQWLGVGLMSLPAYQFVHWLLVGALLMTAIGFRARFFAHVAWISYFVYIGTTLGFTKAADASYVSHSKNIGVFVLFILAISPGLSIWGVDGWWTRGRRWMPMDDAQRTISAWPNQLIKLCLGLAYFGAGFTKNWLWADGYSLQAYLVSKHLLVGEGTEWGLWLAQHYWLCLALSLGTLVLEYGFITAVLFPRLKWFYVIGGLTFHSMIYLTMKINFFSYFALTYLIFLDWGTVKSLLQPLRSLQGIWQSIRTCTTPKMLAGWLFGGNRSSEVIGETRFARNAILRIAGLLLLCVVARIECWPLTDYRVFKSRYSFDKIQVYRFATLDENGEAKFIDPADLPLSPTSLNTQVRRADEAGKQQLVRQVADYLEQHQQIAASSVILVQRKVLPDQSGSPLFVDEPIVLNAMASDVQIADAEMTSDSMMR